MMNDPNSCSIEQIIDLTDDDQDTLTVDNDSFKTVVKKERDTSYNPVNIITDKFIILENPDFDAEKSYVQENREEDEILPPPLTLDDPCPPRRSRKKLRTKISENITRENTDLNKASHRRLQRNCKNKITNYSEENLLDNDMDTSAFLSTGTETCQNQQQSQSVMKGDHLCDLCDASFQKASGLKRHKMWKHSSKPNVSNLKVEVEKFDCEEAPELEEADQKPDASMNRIGKRKKQYSCPQCGKKFSFKCNMRRHLGIHLGNVPKHECSQCGKLCSTKQALVGHVRFIHTGERPYQCKVCLATFVTNSDLHRHMSKHSDVRRYKCTDCGKGFKLRASLIQHVQRKWKEKTWHCGVCTKRFACKSSLKCHMVVHSDIKRYECESCQRQFSHRNSLEAHMAVHAGLMPYVCSVCGKKFAHKSNRNRHIRQMHK